MVSGKLEHFPIHHLLKELTCTQQSGVLALRSGQDSGRICFDSGHICNLVIEGKDDLTPQEGLTEILHWRAGSFDMFYLHWPHPPRPGPERTANRVAGKAVFIHDSDLFVG